MEALLSSGGPQTDVLVGPLKYGLDPQGSYIQQRRQATTFSNVNSAEAGGGVRTITINVGSSSEWIDPSTILLSFLITNRSTTLDLFPATPNPAVLFSRLQLRMGSTLIEDIEQYGKLSNIMTKLSMSPGKMMDMNQLGFGTETVATNPNPFLAGQHDARQILKKHGTNQNFKRVYMKFDLSGLFNCGKFLPLFALGGLGLQIQLTLAPAAEAMILSHTVNSVTTNYSQDYVLTDIRLLSDMISLSGQLQEEYNAAMLQGTSLKIPIKSWETIVNYLPSDSAGNFDLAISKNYTRLASLFCCFDKNPPSDNGTKEKIVNTNYFPGGAAIEDLQYALHLGSERLPDNDVRGTKEAWFRLLGALGLRDSLAHSTSVDEDSYNSDHFCIGIDCEKMPMVMASGANLSTGQTIFLKVKGMGTDSTNVPRRATICAHFEKIVSIQDTVVDVFE